MYEPKKDDRVKTLVEHKYNGVTIPVGAKGTVLENSNFPWVKFDGICVPNTSSTYVGAYPVHNYDLELVNEESFTWSDLKTGMRVEVLSGKIYIVMIVELNGVIETVLADSNGFMDKRKYNEDLSYKGYYPEDFLIAKIYDVTNNKSNLFNPSLKGRILVDFTAKKEAPFIKAKIGDTIKIVNENSSHSPEVSVGDILTVEQVDGDSVTTKAVTECGRNVFYDLNKEYIILDESDPDYPKEIIKEMSIEEIQEKLGYKIKVIE